MRQEADVVCELRCRLRDTRKRRKNRVVYLARIGLAAHLDKPVKTYLLGDEHIELLHLFVVAVEERKEARLCARSALGAEKGHLAFEALHGFEVEKEVLDPQAGPLADRGELGRLEVRKRKRWQRTVPPGEIGQGTRSGGDFARNDAQRLPHQDKVRVVADVGAGGAEVDYGPGIGTLDSVGPDVAHHIVERLALVRLGVGVVYLVAKPLHLGNLLVGNAEPELFLGLCQRNPERPPRAELPVGRKDRARLIGAPARHKRVFKTVAHFRLLSDPQLGEYVTG